MPHKTKEADLFGQHAQGSWTPEMYTISRGYRTSPLFQKRDPIFVVSALHIPRSRWSWGEIDDGDLIIYHNRPNDTMIRETRPNLRWAPQITSAAENCWHLIRESADCAKESGLLASEAFRCFLIWRASIHRVVFCEVSKGYHNKESNHQSLVFRFHFHCATCRRPTALFTSHFSRTQSRRSECQPVLWSPMSLAVAEHIFGIATRNCIPRYASRLKEPLQCLLRLLGVSYYVLILGEYRFAIFSTFWCFLNRPDLKL